MKIELIKQLREKTGAAIIDCQKALKESKDNFEKAVEILRKRGQKVALSKQGKETKNGVIGVYLHTNQQVAAMVELVCETDFVAKNQEFKELAHDLAMQVVAFNPSYLSRENVPVEILEKEKEIYQEELLNDPQQRKKPKEILEKIVDGKLNKFYQELCFLDQPFIKNEKITINDLITTKIARLKENIQIKRFVRFQI